MVDVLPEHDDFGRTAIHYAAAYGDVGELTRLLSEGVDPDEPDNAGFTALHFAAQEQHPAAVELLLAAGVNIQAADRWGNTPLWRAVFTAHGDTSVPTALVAAGADPDTPNTTGISPRLLAQRMGLDGLAAGPTGT